jgi:hypothetical protein
MGFDKIVEIANSKEVLEGVELPKVHLHKWLVLGQTDYLCENGTLSDGHEKLTDAQKYAQALRELYYISFGIQEAECTAMIAQADILEAEEEIADAAKYGHKADEIRAQAKLKRAKSVMVRCAVEVEDRSRMAKFYYKKIHELKPTVEAKYPGGIEQAEQDNWETVAMYRLEKEKTPGLAKERMDHIPLPAERKAILGYATGRFDLIAPLKVSNEERCKEIAQAFERHALEQKEQTKEMV